MPAKAPAHSSLLVLLRGTPGSAPQSWWEGHSSSRFPNSGPAPLALPLRLLRTQGWLLKGWGECAAQWEQVERAPSPGCAASAHVLGQSQCSVVGPQARATPVRSPVLASCHGWLHLPIASMHRGTEPSSMPTPRGSSAVTRIRTPMTHGQPPSPPPALLAPITRSSMAPRLCYLFGS